MQGSNDENKILLPHHEQQTLCTTRLPYRQGRKLTAVKVYSISRESNHLLIFGVPSLNLRQETKALFIKFGKLLQFNISKDHASESFTETYHAQYERIQSARLAKRMLDTKNFYGGSLHVCYAPELENVEEARRKLMQRQRDVIYRLRNLNKEQNNTTSAADPKVADTNLGTKILDYDKKNNIASNSEDGCRKLNMGDVNTICFDKQVKVNKKRKLNNDKRHLPCFVDDKKIKTCDTNITSDITGCYNVSSDYITTGNTSCNSETVDGNRNSNSNVSTDLTNHDVIQKTTKGNKSNIAIINITNSYVATSNDGNIEVVDCTGVDNEVITNINEHLNYNKFGGEVIRKIPQKPVNKIMFHLDKKS